jgi:hypothetical protein
VAFAWTSHVIGGAVTAKVLMVLAITVAFVGASRLAREAPWPVRLAAGTVYALSPLLLTRVGVGQWTVFVPFAVLAWALPSLLVPEEVPPRTFLWAVAMGATGSIGGVLALLAVSVGLMAGRGRWWRSLGLVLLAQLPWLLPGLVVQAGGPHPAGGEAFSTRAEGVVGLASLFAGHGFWRPSSQVGGDAGAGSALIGVGLFGLALLGASRLPRPWRWRALGLAGLGLTLGAASALPGLRELHAAFTETVLGAPFRESQRFLVLTSVWMAPAAAHGAARLAARPGLVPGPAILAIPTTAAVVLALPGLWGVGGRLRPVEIPDDWERARLAVRRQPGSVLALPYHRYLDLPLAGGRRVLNPLPDYLGGDVVTSSDPGLGPDHREAVDPREPHLSAALARARQGEWIGQHLGRLGIRHVAVLHAVDWQDYASLRADPTMRPVVLGDNLDLLAVSSWRGNVVDDQGRAVPNRAAIGPLHHLAGSPSATWSQPWARGWMRGMRAAKPGEGGLVRLPAARGPLWFWPTVVVLLGDAGVFAAVLAAWKRSS